MVRVVHELSTMGKRWSGMSVVTFFRCSAMMEVQRKNGSGAITHTTMQCNFMRPDKYQKRKPGERRK